ncbi:hypothetical protein COLO4_28195 [Corchorus olitorius]|uniref:Uncharacterized protein n=1 Tax=Corchorus olitorius TaxID=93759 RepID=A0A1R3HMF3_9ROSI|nr:hypothetical protein COLO4_28195 [Corchorus olitorius]
MESEHINVTLQPISPTVVEQDDDCIEGDSKIRSEAASKSQEEEENFEDVGCLSKFGPKDNIWTRSSRVQVLWDCDEL